MTESKTRNSKTAVRETADPGTDSMFERTLRRTPAQRLADAARVARFVLRTREKVRVASHG